MRSLVARCSARFLLLAVLAGSIPAAQAQIQPADKAPFVVISASSQPFPPSKSRSALDPSALPLAKAYTYLGARADGRREARRALARLPACAIDDPLSGPPVAETKTQAQPRGLR